MDTSLIDKNCHARLVFVICLIVSSHFKGKGFLQFEKSERIQNQTINQSTINRKLQETIGLYE